MGEDFFASCSRVVVRQRLDAKRRLCASFNESIPIFAFSVRPRGRRYKKSNNKLEGKVAERDRVLSTIKETLVSVSPSD